MTKNKKAGRPPLGFISNSKVSHNSLRIVREREKEGGIGEAREREKEGGIGEEEKVIVK